MQDYAAAPILDYPPAALQNPSSPTLSNDPTSSDQNKWTASISGQQWGNGAYEVKVSSVWTDGGTQYCQMFQIFDKIAQSYPHFAANHYSSTSGEYTFGNKSGYTLDGQYFGKILLHVHAYHADSTLICMCIYIYIYIYTHVYVEICLSKWFLWLLVVCL